MFYRHFARPVLFNKDASYSTLFSPPKRRRKDIRALDVLKNTLLFVLRNATSKEYGFGNRPDGYVSVRRLLQHPEFQSLDIAKLQNIVTRDTKHRFDLQFDATKGTDMYWIRAKQWNETHWVLKPLVPKDQPGTPVYATTLEQWHDHIARNGIPRGDNEWIEVFRRIPSPEYLEEKDHQQVFIYFNLSKTINAGIRFFSPTPSSQKWFNDTPLITKGNQTGYIPPCLFAKVELVTITKKVVWGDPKPISQRLLTGVGCDPFDFTPTGERQTFAPALWGTRGGGGITRFVSTNTTNLSVLRSYGGGGGPLRLEDVPGRKEELIAVLRS